MSEAAIHSWNENDFAGNFAIILYIMETTDD